MLLDGGNLIPPKMTLNVRIVSSTSSCQGARNPAPRGTILDETYPSVTARILDAGNLAPTERHPIGKSSLAKVSSQGGCSPERTSTNLCVHMNASTTQSPILHTPGRTAMSLVSRSQKQQKMRPNVQRTSMTEMPRGVRNQVQKVRTQGEKSFVATTQHPNCSPPIPRALLLSETSRTLKTSHLVARTTVSTSWSQASDSL